MYINKFIVLLGPGIPHIDPQVFKETSKLQLSRFSALAMELISHMTPLCMDILVVMKTEFIL